VTGITPAFEPDGLTMKYSAFKDVTWVHGGTLDRYWIDKDLSTEFTEWYWVYTVPDSTSGIGCDGCVKVHNTKNMECGAWTGTTTMTDTTKLYSFNSDAVIDYPNIVATHDTRTAISAVEFEITPATAGRTY
jgi:hypothetical protein